MEPYERPVVLATYTVEELVEEAAICVAYGKGHAYGRDHGKGGPPVGVNPPGKGKIK